MIIDRSLINRMLANAPDDRGRAQIDRLARSLRVHFPTDKDPQAVTRVLSAMRNTETIAITEAARGAA